MAGTSTLTSTIPYADKVGAASWEGRHVHDVAQFKSYVREAVHPRVADAGESFEPDLRGLATTGMATEAARRRLQGVLGTGGAANVSDEQLRFVANGLELWAFEQIEVENSEPLRVASAAAFQVARSVPRDTSPLEAAESLVRLGVLGDRGADVRRLLIEEGIPSLPFDAVDWGTRVWGNILDVWLRLLRKSGWNDLDAVQERVAMLRAEQRSIEPGFLAEAEQRNDTSKPGC